MGFWHLFPATKILGHFFRAKQFPPGPSFFISFRVRTWRHIWLCFFMGACTGWMVWRGMILVISDGEFPLGIQLSRWNLPFRISQNPPHLFCGAAAAKKWILDPPNVTPDGIWKWWISQHSICLLKKKSVVFGLQVDLPFVVSHTGASH